MKLTIPGSMPRFAHILLIAFLVSAGACRSSWKNVDRSPGFQLDESKPLRVAVIPFEDKAGGRSAFVYPFLPFIYLANILTLSVPEAGPDTAKGAENLRALFIALSSNPAVRYVPTRATDTALAHSGLLDKANKMDAVELGKLLGVDAVLYGELLDWAAHYYVVESRTIVEARVRLVSCLDRRELLNITIGVSDAAGVSGGPTGYISAAATPLAALGKGDYNDLAVAWADRASAALLESRKPIEKFEDVTNGIKDDNTNLDSLLNSESNTWRSVSLTPATPPYIAAAAISPAPARGWRSGDWVEIVALGAPGCDATFDVGTLHTRIPLVEYARVPRDGATGEIAGVYRGAFFVGSEDFVSNAPVLVNFTKNGLAAARSASGDPITITGAPRAAAR